MTRTALPWAVAFAAAAVAGCGAADLTRESGVARGAARTGAAMLGTTGRIVTLGDSITDGHTYPLLVAQALEEAGKPVPVFTGAGIGGDVAKGMRARLDRDVLVHRPALVMLSCGINDLHRGVPPEDYETDVQAIAEHLGAEGIRLILLTTTNLRGGARAEELKAYHDAIRRVAATHGLKIVEVYRSMEAGRAAGEDLWEADGCHLSFAGYRRFASAVLDAMGHEDVPVPAELRCEPMPGIIREWKVLALPDGEPRLDEARAEALRVDGRWEDYPLPEEGTELHWWLDQERDRGVAVSLEIFGGSRFLALAKVPGPARRACVNTGAELSAVWANGTKLPVDTSRGWHPGANRIPVDLVDGENVIVIETGGRFFFSITDGDDW